MRGKLDLPEMPVPDRLTKLSDALAKRMPPPSEIVRANFELTERPLSAQGDLSMRLLGASVVSAEVDAPAPSKTAGTAKKSASAK